MKSLNRILALSFALLLAAAFIPAFALAEGEWRDDLRRMNDLSRVLDEAISDSINEEACAAVEELEYDFVLVTYTDELRGTRTDAQYVEYLYSNNGLGYGETHDGVIFGYNTDADTFVLRAEGRGEYVFGWNGLKAVADDVRRGLSSNGVAGAMQAFLDSAKAIVAESDYPYIPASLMEYGDIGYEGFNAVSFYSEDPVPSGRPDWYPEDMASWTWTPAPADAPRVIDDADLFTDEEEVMLRSRISDATAAQAVDVVVVTVPSTGDIQHMDYADDYYDYHGYGVGSEHDGFLRRRGAERAETALLAGSGGRAAAPHPALRVGA